MTFMYFSQTLDYAENRSEDHTTRSSGFYYNHVRYLQEFQNVYSGLQHYGLGILDAVIDANGPVSQNDKDHLYWTMPVVLAILTAGLYQDMHEMTPAQRAREYVYAQTGLNNALIAVFVRAVIMHNPNLRENYYPDDFPN